MPDPAIPDVVRSRRAVLAAAAGGAAALAATAMGPASVAAVAANMQTETDNATTAATGVTNATAGDTALFGNAAGDGVGIQATSEAGPGITGQSQDTSDPTNNTQNVGIVGVAGDMGDIASNVALTGVYGFSEASPDVDHVGAGVWGDSPEFGVIGTGGGAGVFGDGFLGVLGVAEDAAGVGVWAEAGVAGARALSVLGRAEFSRSGKATITKGSSSKKVTLAGCTASTLVLAVLGSNRSGRWVRAVVPAAGSFTVYLNGTVTAATYIVWIAFTNPVNHSG